ncbi:predicted protein [Aspergillus nidulans FGSC A4]|uniref:Uncharacterized protein n=1 Tax=Emericella nidulans (strain FGSC A4 / ATCC 38163 / CBS 112.46 / NRRL 194 / M139) TaxID=227321 RepID=Q5AX04_EMENI|nr:hypothetical protein [Aspergillus nidulans FGSC A4]EAA61428.1 predicted protein [Aspergillus nidulans FGSC A4]CBF78924.1 TPA: conserved hypothetical protein [Aspergillus nidulans FGSC A4]|eukprot:XP_664780.1 predicted protein [Aspergillus nidulans FGSC A4]
MVDIATNVLTTTVSVQSVSRHAISFWLRCLSPVSANHDSPLWEAQSVLEHPTELRINTLGIEPITRSSHYEDVRSNFNFDINQVDGETQNELLMVVTSVEPFQLTYLEPIIFYTEHAIAVEHADSVLNRKEPWTRHTLDSISDAYCMQ